MAKFKFSLKLTADIDKLIELTTKYEDYSTYLPNNIKDVKIIEKNGSTVITEETLVLSSFIKKEFKQEAKHQQITEHILLTEILSGPAKGSIINIIFSKEEYGTNVEVTIELKLDLKSKILQPIIKKYYKIILTSILYKINTKAMSMTNKMK